MEKKKKKYYPKEFKLEAVNLVAKKGYKITEAAKNLGVSESAIRHWKKQFDPNSKSSDSGLLAENNRLKRENKRLLMEREILKKAAAFFAKETL